MKLIYITLFTWLFVNWAEAQTTIKFIINKPDSISAVVDGGKKLIHDTIIYSEHKPLFIEVNSKTGLKYKFKISRGRESLLEKNEQDFLKDNKLIIDTNLKIGTVSLVGNIIVRIRTIPDRNSEAETFIRSINLAFSNNPNPNPIPGPNGSGTDPKKPTYKPGIPYYDAYALIDNTHTTKADWLKIFRYYCKNMNLLAGAVGEKLKDNPFLKKSFVINDTYYQPPPKGKEAGAHSGITEFISGKALSSLGGLDVTNIADGFAKFLVKRTKEELNIAFFSKFKETLNDPIYRDLKTLFPQTWELLEAIGDEIYNYNRYLQNLREAFQSDIKTLDENLPGIIPNHSDFFDHHFELAASLNSACYITGALKKQVHPGDILENYPMEYLKRNDNGPFFNKNWSGAIQTLQLLSESLRDTSSGVDDKYWVDSKKIKELVNNEDVFKIYLGLIYQLAITRYDSIQYKNGSLVELMDMAGKDFNNDYNAYKRYISNFALKVNDLNEMLKKYKNPKNDSVAVENYTKFFKSSVGLIEYCTEVSTLPHFNSIVKINLHDSFKNYFKITYETSDLVTDINRRNYSSAINHAMTIYNLVRTKALEVDLRKISQSGKNAVNTDQQATYKVKRAKKKYNNAVDTYVKKVLGETLPDSVKYIVLLSTDTIYSAKKLAVMKALQKCTDSLIDELNSPTRDSAKIKSLLKNRNSLLAELPLPPVATTPNTIKVLNQTQENLLKKKEDSIQSTLKTSLKNSKDALQKFVRYGTFMSTIATAKNSDDVEKAIEAAALPSGSSRIKRETPFNVSLNAYCGLFMGYEQIKGKDPAWPFCKINSYGITAPIGVAISTGGHSFAFACPHNEGHWSYSLFISLIDIGAVASFRFQNNDSVDQVPTIKLQDIFSPGLFLSVGFPKCPLSLNLGAQVGPNLRNVNVEDKKNPGQYINSYQNNVYWRFSASLVVDIPILNFYTKSKK